MSLDDAFILAGTHGLSGAFGWLLCSVAARARAERVRRQREQILVWAENAEREAEMARLSCPPPVGHPGYDVLARELGLVCPPDASSLTTEQVQAIAKAHMVQPGTPDHGEVLRRLAELEVAEQNRKAAEWAVIDLRDPSDGAR